MIGPNNIVVGRLILYYGKEGQVYYSFKCFNFFPYASMYGAGFHYQRITEQSLTPPSGSKTKTTQYQVKRPRPQTAARLLLRQPKLSFNDEHTTHNSPDAALYKAEFRQQQTA
jgi:hypothetical protein